jgi:hypothetical protein
MQWKPLIGFDMAFSALIQNAPSLNLWSVCNQTVAPDKPGI